MNSFNNLVVVWYEMILFIDYGDSFVVVWYLVIFFFNRYKY